MIDDGGMFRWFAALALASLVFAWYRAVRTAGISRETFYASAEGPALAIPIRVLFQLCLLGTFLYVVNPRWMAWASFPLPASARWGGVLLTVAALGLYVWAMSALGRQFGVTLGIKKSHRLVTSGPYRWVRHPQYTMLVLLWSGFLLLTANWFIGVTGILTMVITMALRTPKEERLMLQTFGDEYRSYMQRTGRYLPRLFSGRAEGRGDSARIS